jgi:D-alanine-D-alanine ligase
MAEKYIDGREFNVAAFGSDRVTVLPPAETEFRGFPASLPKITTYEAKWDSGSEFYRKTESVCPARIPLRLAEELKSITLKLYKIFEADSYARADFRMDARGRIFFLEFNPNPDISPSSGFRKALSAARIPFGAFAEELVKTAARRRRNKK